MYDTKQVIVMRKDLNMRKGKMCAQAAHASLGIFTGKMQGVGTGHVVLVLNDVIESWLKNSYKKVTVGVTSEEHLLELYDIAKKEELPCILITDSGLTEFGGVPTNTCIAIGPAKSEDIDKITGNLKLL